MRTLALLAAILLVALQAQAEHISVSIDEVVDQQPPQAEDQDVAIYVKEHESSALEALGERCSTAELHRLRGGAGHGPWDSLGEQLR